MTQEAELVDRSCPVCDSTGNSRVVADARVDPGRLDAYAFASRKVPEYMHYRLVLCSACDCVYASPAPSPEMTSPAYQEAAFDSSVESHYAARSYGRILSRFVGRLPDLAGALDVGTGDGAFLEQLLARGFTDVVGVEPSSAPIATATEEIRRLIVQGSFEAHRFEPGRYSLVTCFQTLEHLHDPGAMCDGAYRLLKPGGAFFVICHNRRALSAKLLGARSPIFDIEHLQLFSPASITRLLERHGFENIEVRSLWNTYPVHYWMKLAPSPRALKRFAVAASKTMGFGHLPVAIPAGNIAAIGSKPPAATGGIG